MLQERAIAKPATSRELVYASPQFIFWRVYASREFTFRR